jgi:Tol biopolymer transport system component
MKSLFQQVCLPEFQPMLVPIALNPVGAISGGFQVCEYDFASRKTRILTSGSAHHIQPCWANDGRHLYMTQRTTSGATRIMLLDTEFEEAKPMALHNEKFGNCSQVSFYYPN